MSNGVSAHLSQRLDVWLHNARFAKTRSLALALVERGKVRLNRVKAAKPAQGVKPGDILTVSLGPRVRIVEITDLAARRGSAAEAILLYRELTPVADKTTQSAPADRLPPATHSASHGERARGMGRPTKRERRDIVRLKNRFGDV